MRHLSEEEICRWLSGEQDAAFEAHIANCSACRAQVTRAGEAIAGFSELVHERSSRRMVEHDNKWSRGFRGLAAKENAKPAMRTRVWGAGLATAGAALCLSVGWWNVQRERPAGPVARIAVEQQVEQSRATAQERRSASAVAQPVSDTELLQRVDAEVSRTIPGPMEPLTKLVEWQVEAKAQ